MATETKPLEPRSWTDPIATTRGNGYRIVPGAPLATFYNPNADSWLRTRDVHIYRALPEWVEKPFDARAVVPRSPR